MPEISIIIPYYNSEKTINITINSILSQSFTEFEIILINAGTDNLEKTVNQIKNKRIKLYNIEHKGTVYSYIQGIKKSEGKYITFCDSDDIMPKEAVEVVGIDDVISFHEDLLKRLSSPPEGFSVQDLLLCNGFERVL